MDLKKHITAILLMGGSGVRFNSDTPKQFHRIAGKKIYQHTLERFIESGYFDEILLVCHEKWINQVQEEVASYASLPVRVILGGASRQESSYKGLLSCKKNTDIVVLHDAVRPFVSERILEENIRATKISFAVDTCIPSSDTIVHSKNQETISSIPNRSEYLRGQTPQSFSYPLILQAHEKALSQGIVNASDDCSLITCLGKEVSIVQGEERNIKITTELDLFLAEQLFRLAETPSYNENISLAGKHYVVTGGSRGIGKAVAVLLEKEGAKAQIISRSSEQSADLTSFSQTREVFDKIHTTFGPIDGLINCAGFFINKEFSDLSHKEIDELLDANLKTLLYPCKCAQIKAGGHVVNIASSAYSRGRKGSTIYSCAKAGVVNFTQGLAVERQDLFINVVVPQRTNTTLRKENFPFEDPSQLLSPEEVAHSIVSLLKQTKITGTIVEVRKS